MLSKFKKRSLGADEMYPDSVIEYITPPSQPGVIVIFSSKIS